MGFYFILPLYFFLCFKNYVLEFFFTLSFFFIFIIIKSYSFDTFFFMFDITSWSLVILSILILSFMFLSNLSFSLEYCGGSSFSFNLSLMLTSLFLVFSSSNVFMFYVFFEFSIIPIFFVLCGWGFMFERFQASFYMMIYTLFFSLPFLIFICMIYCDLKTIVFFISMYIYYSNFNFFFTFISVFMFLVKLPSFFLHLWLPKAHVEAPVSGSMILAGLLLKLGAYGLLVFLPFIYFNCLIMSSYFFSLGLWGGLLASIICFRQIDLKKLVAYMSISHMGMVLSGIFTFYYTSLFGVVLMLLAHGLSSSGLFYSLNCLYERYHSRSLVLMSGKNILLIGLSIWFFILICSNISAPPTINFFSELTLLFGVSMFSLYNLIIFLIIMFIGTISSFYLYVSIFHGFSIVLYSFESLLVKEHLILMTHSLFIFMLFSIL